MTTPDRKDALPAGTQLQSYRLQHVLGSGTFGITYYAEHSYLEHNHYVIKEYLPDNALRTDGSTVIPRSAQERPLFNWGLTSFFAEARLLHRLKHPHIVKVTDLFEANGTAYFVMPYLEGETLHDWIGHHPKPTQAELEAIFVPLLEGLKYIHERDLLHRDIKPENIYLTTEGHPILIDFGAARIALGQKSKVLTQILTPHFAPLEQYATKGDFTPSSDLYSLAGCLYYAITHDLPEEAPNRVVNDDQLKLVGSRYQTSYSQPFLAAIDQGLALYPQQRPVDGFAMQKQLLNFAEDKSKPKPSIKQPTGGESGETTGGGQGKTLGAGWRKPLLVLVLLLVVGVGGYIGYHSQSDPPVRQQTEPKQPELLDYAEQIKAELEQQERQRQAELERQRQAELERQRQAQKQSLVEPKSGIKFIKIPGGCVGALCVHQGGSFWVSETEVTQEQWNKVMDDNPSRFKGDDRPVENMTWYAATEFAAKLGNGYRLLTEDEWEYAARAGSEGDYSLDQNGNEVTKKNLGDYAWYDANAGGKTHPVGEKEPNKFGLYDMHGNVWEWTCSAWDRDLNGADGCISKNQAKSNKSRVIRGGSWTSNAGRLRAAYRNYYFGPSNDFNLLGLRLARDE